MFNQLGSKYVHLPTSQFGIDWTVKLLCHADVVAGGNKSYKLKYNLIRAQELGLQHLVTVGGAYSNHIAATANAGARLGFKTTGIIRGEPVVNPTLLRAQRDGMELIFVSRESYRLREEPNFAERILNREKDWWFMPEGGNNVFGVRGCTEILESTDANYDLITVCCGTGTTLRGMALSLMPHQRLMGFSVLRNETALFEDLPQTTMVHDYHFGGYARKTPELDAFCNDFAPKHQVEIEPVYTGKMFFGIQQMIAQGRFAAGTRLLSVHTGGLQYLVP